MTRWILAVCAAAGAAAGAIAPTPAAAPAPASAPPPGATIQAVAFEITPQETTVLVATSQPAPRYTVVLQTGEVVVRFAHALSRLDAEYPSPVAYLGTVRVESPAAGAAGEVVLHISPRATTLAGVEGRDDGIALRFPAGSPDGAAAIGEYEVGVGDKIDVTVFGHDDLTRTVEVRADGSANLPLLGDVMVAGKGVSAIADDLRARLGTEFLVDPRVSVEVREYRSHWVTLMGEVRSPGRYPLRRNMRLLDVLAEAGGPTKEAGRQLRVTSPGNGDAVPSERVIDLQDLMKAGTSEANPMLHHGEVITVLERELFYIRGEVNRPSAYVLEGGMTLVKAIAIAGGLTPYASRKDVQILRSAAGGQARLTINLKAIEEGKHDDLPLRADDVIIVSRRIF